MTFARIMRTFVAAAAMLTASAAWAQSSSMFHRAQQGQFGSNQPATANPQDQPSAPAAPATPPAPPTPSAEQTATNTATSAAGQPGPGPGPANPGATGPANASTGQPGSAKSPASPPGGDPTVAANKAPAAPPVSADSPGQVISLSNPPSQLPADLSQTPAALFALTAPPATLQATSMMSPPGAGPELRADQTRPNAGNNGTGHNRSVSAAMTTLQQVSFTATVSPEPRRFQAHDLLTIIVREETSFTSDGQSTQDKKYNFDSKLDSWAKPHWGNIPFKAYPPTVAPEIKAENERKLDSQGTFNRKDSFVGRLTAEIVDVKPNGTLVLSARKFIKNDDEEQTFELTGTCRVSDITADNSVLSTQLADLSVHQTHEGQVRDTTKRGWESWLSDKINPW